jgi:hypothetical protein
MNDRLLVLQFTLGSTNAGGRFLAILTLTVAMNATLPGWIWPSRSRGTTIYGVRSGHQFRGREPRKGRAMLPDLKVNLENGLVALITSLS